MKLLFESEFNLDTTSEETLCLIGEEGLDKDDYKYIQRVKQGVLSNLSSIDEAIAQSAIGWDIERMSKVDKSILRLAVYEMLHEEKIPVSVSVSEAVNMSRIYSTDESGAFINGILGAVSRKLDEK